MTTAIIRSLVVAALISVSPISSALATCGGGGGGGAGGGGDQVFLVPWRKVLGEQAPAKEGLIVYWIPSNRAEFMSSSLRKSRPLSLYATRCISMALVDADSPLAQKLADGRKLPLAVLTKADGTVVASALPASGALQVAQVESMVDTEMKRRALAVRDHMTQGKQKAQAGDKDGATAEFKAVLEEKCFFPGRAKEAVEALKGLGVNDVSLTIPSGGDLDEVASKRTETLMDRGLKAEEASQFRTSERLYLEAHRLDPSDPTPLRYLGELYRHHIGDWDKARTTFNEILSMQADPLSKAVALHGLGKMTIHDGEFKKGLSLMEQSVETYPTAMAYRNLAVYWNSEGDQAKAQKYTQEALNLEPNDPYNLVFSAVFMAAAGKGDEALKIAREHSNLMPASYNLAAIYAQTGHKKEALAMLERHFFQYERTKNVRSKEMMEARVDRVFAAFNGDPQFMKLTGGADGKLTVPMLDPSSSQNPRQQVEQKDQQR